MRANVAVDVIIHGLGLISAGAGSELARRGVARRAVRGLRLTFCSIGLLVFVAGCTAISVQPTCPAELQVGETGNVLANETNPGAIARYLWEAIPASGGTFADPTMKDTTFTAREPGVVELRLVASDGLYSVLNSCRTTVLPAPDVMVTLTASPTPAVTEQPVTLTCTSTGKVAATSFEITQVSGPNIARTEISPGVVQITPIVAGSPQFQCVGISDEGERSLPTTLTLQVQQGGGGR